jgi:AcrR family transcriptional regulator
MDEQTYAVDQMSSRPETAPARRAPLSKERVLEAAVAFADEHGIDALSMRRLAKELGVEAMSLYNHVKNKDDLLAGIIDLATSEIELPEVDGDWKAAMRRSSISAKDVYLRHTWLTGLMHSKQSGGPASLRRGEWMLATLREAGFSDDLTYHAYHIIGAYLMGVTAQHLSVAPVKEDLAGMARQFLAQLPPGQYPYMIEHVEQHIDPDHQHTGGFELGLDLLLDGLERLRTAA